MVQLQLRLHAHPLRPYLHDAEPVEVSSDRTTTISDLKNGISSQWKDKPATEGLVLVLGGRVLSDKESLWELLEKREEEATSPVIHVIVKPTAWTTTTLTSEQTATPLPALVTPPPVSPPAASTSTPPTAAFTAFTSTPATATPLAANNVVFGKFVAHLAMMAPMQRTTLLLELQKGHFVYTQLVQLRMTLLGWSEDNALSIRSDTISRKTGQKEPYDINEGESEEDWRARMGEEEIEQVVELLKGCDLWALVEERIAVARGDMENWDARNPAGKPGAVKGEFELVQVGGLPYLLQTPRQYILATPAPPAELYVAMKRAFAITQILVTLLQLLITYAPLTPSLAYGRGAELRRTLLDAAGALPDGVPPIAALGLAGGLAGGALPRRALGVRRRGTVNIIINVEAMISIGIPLIFLALKLAFLLWIFGRHASTNKRIAMGVMALAYIIWEGWTLARAGRPRRGRVPGARAGAAAPVAGVNIDRAAPVLPDGLRQRHNAPVDPANPAPAAVPGVVPAAPARTPRPPSSRLTPRYWINYIAAIGLAAEARELGLIPRSIAGRPVVNPPVPARNPNDLIGVARDARARAVRTALVAVVLFFGTLLPEVEKKRRRALEKRERLLESRRVNRLRRAAVAAAAALGPAGGNVRGAESGVSTPGVLGIVTPVIDDPPAVTPAANSSPADPSSTGVTALSSSTAPGPSTSTTTLQDAAPAGRGVVSDAALFVDEPARMPPPPPTAANPIPAAPAPEIEPEENDEVDLMTDEAEGEGEEEEGEVDNVAALF